MSKYLFIYHGGKKPDPSEVPELMQAWGSWFETLGTAVIDGGNPVGLSTTVHSDGSISNDGGSNPCSGYSLIDASSTEDAIEKALSCPVLASGGSIELAEAINM